MNILIRRWPGVTGFEAIKAGLILFVFCVTAFFVSRGIVVVVGSEWSFSTLMEAFVPVAIPFAVFLLLLLVDFSSVSSLLARSQITFKQALVVLLLAALVALSPLPYMGNLPHLGLTIAVLVGIAMAAFLMATRDDHWGISVFLLVDPFVSYVQYDLGNLWPRSIPPWINMSYTCLLLLAGLALARRVLSGKGVFISSPIDKLIFALVVVLFLSSIASPNPTKSFETFFQIGLVLPLLYFLVTNRVRDRQGIIVFVGALVARSTLRSAMILYSSLQSAGFDLSEQVASSSGGLLDKAVGAQAATSVYIPLAISLALVLSVRSRKWVFPALAALFLVVALLDAQVRSALMIPAVMSPIALFYRRGKRVLLVGLIAVAVVVLASGKGPELFKRYNTLTSNQGWEGELAMRVDGWTAALKMMRDYPFLGIGLDRWREVFPSYGNVFRWRSNAGPVNVYISHAHSLHLHLGAEAGVGALLALLLIGIEAARRLFLLVTKTRDFVIQTIAVGFAWTFVGYFIYGGLLNERGWLDGAIVFWVPLAMVMVLDRVARQEMPLENVGQHHNSDGATAGAGCKQSASNTALSFS